MEKAQVKKTKSLEHGPEPNDRGFVQELGSKIPFIADLDKAIEASVNHGGKPIFLLFQEIPGCSTCTMFGDNVLSNDSIAKFVSKHFIPCVVNNRGRTEKDRLALRRFREPHLNNPVVRFINVNGSDLIARKEGVYTTKEMLARMIEAKSAAAAGTAAAAASNTAVASTRTSPSSQANLGLQIGTQQAFQSDLGNCENCLRKCKCKAQVKSLTFSMGCYWEGEKVLGSVPGVAATTPGWVGGREVVKVDYEAAQAQVVQQLLSKAKKHGFSLLTSSTAERRLAEAQHVSVITKSKHALESMRRVSASEEKYYLKRALPKTFVALLSPTQQARINSCIASGTNFEHFLTDEQRKHFTVPA